MLRVRLNNMPCVCTPEKKIRTWKRPTRSFPPSNQPTGVILCSQCGRRDSCSSWRSVIARRQAPSQILYERQIAYAQLCLLISFSLLHVRSYYRRIGVGRKRTAGHNHERLSRTRSVYVNMDRLCRRTKCSQTLGPEQPIGFGDAREAQRC